MREISFFISILVITCCKKKGGLYNVHWTSLLFYWKLPPFWIDSCAVHLHGVSIYRGMLMLQDTFNYHQWNSLKSGILCRLPIGFGGNVPRIHSRHVSPSSQHASTHNGCGEVTTNHTGRLKQNTQSQKNLYPCTYTPYLYPWIANRKTLKTLATDSGHLHTCLWCQRAGSYLHSRGVIV